jgi:hypothetical protein
VNAPGATDWATVIDVCRNFSAARLPQSVRAASAKGANVATNMRSRVNL